MRGVPRHSALALALIYRYDECVHVSTWPIRGDPSTPGLSSLAQPGRTMGNLCPGGLAARARLHYVGVNRRNRGEINEERQVMSTQGTVKWFNSEKGFGFIAPDEGGADVFAHYSAIESSGYRSLEENQRVEFEIAQGPKGLQAENIRPI